MKYLRSLSNRIFLAGALLAVVPLGVAIYAVNAAVTRQAQEELGRGLEEAATLVDENRTTLFEHFTREARLIADLPRLKAIVYENDPQTAAPIAETYSRGIGANLLVLTHRTGRVLSSVGAEFAGEAVADRQAIRDAAAGREARAFWAFPGGVLQVASVPVFIDPDQTGQPEILGTLTVGFSLDQDIASRFKALTNSEIAFLIDGEVRAATLPRSEWPTLAKLLGGGEPIVHLGSDDYVWLARPLAATTATVTAPTALILRSRTERLRFLRALHTALAVTAIAAIIAATLLSYGVARTVTHPLGVITATMRETAATGDLTRRITLPPSPIGEDEDAHVLASTFNAMTESIARFQREAAQRARLSSLGRLSTVVAHEIRNPLMIIKANLRTLRRDDLQTPQLRQAVEEIDGEIVRLNRIVTDVLDFARPIQFELAPADLNALCRDAARASGEGNEACPIELRLDPSLPVVVTDAERLRLALVNILTNARHAVEAGEKVPAAAEAGVAGGGAASRASLQAAHPIELRTVRLSPERVAVVVRDRGTGIASEDMPRIFEPYFTTKRAGSGLGLAIARNIVEGLGGSIAVSSRQGHGTEMTLELPIRS